MSKARRGTWTCLCQKLLARGMVGEIQRYVTHIWNMDFKMELYGLIWTNTPIIQNELILMIHYFGGRRPPKIATVFLDD